MIVAVKFDNNSDEFFFTSDEELKKGQKVIAETQRGVQLGYVSNANIKNSQVADLKKIKSIATDKDYDLYLKNLDLARSALDDAKKLVKKNNLNMNLINAMFSLDKKLLLFNFFSEERIDFRNLVKELANKYHTRIELHQIGIRDKAKINGGIGLCGRVLCCHGCLKKISSVNIGMVKNQNIALNPTKINGACGRLLCCFNYENDTYTELRKKLPKLKEKVEYDKKQGEVVSLDILNQTYRIKFKDGSEQEVTVK